MYLIRDKRINTYDLGKTTGMFAYLNSDPKIITCGKFMNRVIKKG